MSDKTEAQNEQEATEKKTILGTVEPEKIDENPNGFDSETGPDKSKAEEEAKRKEEEEKAKQKPEDLDDKYWDEEKKEYKSEELLNDLKKAQKNALDLRKKLSQKGAKIKDAKQYKLEEADSILEVIPTESETMKLLKDSAFESGMDNNQFNTFLKKIIPELKEKGILQTKEAELTQEEKDAQFKEYMEGEVKKLGDKGANIVKTLGNWGHSLVNKGVLSPEDLNVFNEMAYDAPSIRVLMKLRALTGEPTIPIKTAVPSGMPSEEEIKSIMLSEKYKSGDPATVKKVNDWYKMAYPGKSK